MATFLRCTAALVLLLLAACQAAPAWNEPEDGPSEQAPRVTIGGFNSSSFGYVRQ